MRKFVLAAVTCGLAACADAPAPRSPSTSFNPTGPRADAGLATPTARYIVSFRNNIGSVGAAATAVQASTGANIERTFTTALKGAVVTLTPAAAATLRQQPFVAGVEADQRVALSTTQAYPPSWGLDRIDQRAPVGGPGSSYVYTATGSGVTVYIIDTGIQTTHSDFGGRASTGTDIVVGTGVGTDCNGHGTHVAGTVGSATYGVAKGATLVSVRVLDCQGYGSTSDVIAGIDWVTLHKSGPAVANMSLGGQFSPALNAAVEASIAAGVTYVVAAGNSTMDACVASPASAPSAITVGATDAVDAFASFSNYGSCVDINAPGVYITSLWAGPNGTTQTISGTSMASPHVAGAAALYLQLNPGAVPATVASALSASATTNAISGLGSTGTPNRLLYTGNISGAPPVASFASSCSYLACTFDAGSSTALSGATYVWTFGDATGGTGKTTWHGYASTGTRTVTLTVSDANGSNSTSKPVTVTANSAPIATITSPGIGSRAPAGTRIIFSGTGTDLEDGAKTGAAMVWSSSLDGLIGTGQTLSTSSLSVGTHHLTLTVTDSWGATGSATLTLVITPGNQTPVPHYVYQCDPASHTCTFDGASSTDDRGIISYSWIFGDGTVWMGGPVSVKHTWAKGGDYPVTLSVRDASGVTGSVTTTVHVF